MDATKHDPVAVEVHRKSLENLTADMAITLVRTSGSPVVTDSFDFCTCLLDLEGEQLALSSFLMAHSASSLLGTRAVIDLLAETGRKPEPGDGWLVNDPHTTGAMHQGDVGLVMPVFVGDEHVAWVFSNVHILDVGGSGVSGIAPSALTTFEEGMSFPAVQAIKGGRIDPEWERYIAANGRAPAAALNDLRSMLAANNSGRDTLAGIIDRYGLDRHREFGELEKTLTEELLRSRIEQMPDGEYEAVEFVEFDGNGTAELLEVRCVLTVAGSDLKFAFKGDPQVDAFVNAGEGAVLGCVMLIILTTLGYGDLPFNAGMWRPISFDLGEPGTIVNPVKPAPVSLGHAETGARVSALAKSVLNQAVSLSADERLRGRVAGAASDATLLAGLFGVNDDGAPAVMFYMDSAVGLGGPAQSIADGQDCYGMTMMAGAGLPDVELHESMDPVLFLWRRLQANSGGPGAWRGGLSTDRAYALRDAPVTQGFNDVVMRERAAIGTGGGLPGAAGNQYAIRDSEVISILESGIHPVGTEDLHGIADDGKAKEGRFSLFRGDVLRTVGGGGSGLGDPLLRDPQLVVADLRAGYVSTGHAREAYGVIVGEDGKLDPEATAEQRRKLVEERLGAAPEQPLRAPETPGIAIRVEADRSWACNHCGEELCPTAEDWREAVPRRTTGATAYFERLEMRIYPRHAEPPIVVEECFCPACAATLQVDVLPAGTSYRSPRLAGAREVQWELSRGEGR